LRQYVPLTIRTGRPHDERRPIPVRVLHQIVVDARDGDHAGVEGHVRRQFGQGGKGFQVAFHEVVSGRIRITIGPHPSVPLEERRRGRVDVVSPRREHADVSPHSNTGSHVGPSFEDKRGQRTRQHVGRGGQADGPRANDDNGQLLL
jgi:hypothetical protein